MSSKRVQPSLFEPDTLMQAAELQILRDEYKRALQEPPWDGNTVCGASRASSAPFCVVTTCCNCRLLRLGESV